MESIAGLTLKARRLWMPYCIHRRDDGKWLPINREYKPIGVQPYDPWVSYDKFDAYDIEVTDEDRRAIAYPFQRQSLELGRWGGSNSRWIYLYFDGNQPFVGNTKDTRDYMKRVDALMALIAREAAAR